MTVITEFAPAKINLTLEVLGKRPDGYHELQSLVAFAQDAADVVALDLSKPSGCDVAGPFGGTISGKNLIDVTLSKLAATHAGLRLGHVTLQKNLPVAAGIGGGSADAAAVLRAVRRANLDHETTVDWLGLAASLGADVPVCFVSRLSWMMGIGEIVEPLRVVPALSAVLINPLVPMPDDKTARVFKALRAAPLSSSCKSRSLPQFSQAEELLACMSARGNDLQRPAQAVAPVIAEIIAALSQTRGCRYAAVSGAGPTCFGIFADAAGAASELAQAYPQWWIKATRLA